MNKEHEQSSENKPKNEKQAKRETSAITVGAKLTPAKQKRLIKRFGPCPAGYTTKELEQFLDLIYGMHSHVYTPLQLQDIMISDPFDRSDTPRQIKLLDFTDWLEALVS